MRPRFNLYPIQKDFIEKAQRTIEKGQVAIFSSPTGTGKTLSLLLAILPHIKKSAISDFSGVSEKNIELIRQLDFNNTPVYYCSRTHSQLNQAINELKRLDVDCNAVIIGSRMLYCKHEEVKKLSELEIVNEKCKSLREKNECEYFLNLNRDFQTIANEIDDLKAMGRDKLCKKSKIFDIGAKRSKRDKSIKENAQNNNNDYLNIVNDQKMRNSKLDTFQNDNSISKNKKFDFLSTLLDSKTKSNYSFKNSGIYDIEDLKNHNCNFCPYYKSKEFSRSSSITFLPYQMLFCKESRESFKLQIKDAIIIIDEAHNIYESVIQMNSVSVSYSLLQKYISAFSKYKSRFTDEKATPSKNYSTGISNQRKMVADTFLDMLRLLNDFCKDFKDKNFSEEKFYKVNDFLIKSHLENYNMLKLKEYIRTTNITQMLEGYEKGLHFGLFTIVNFLTLLTNSDNNGLIFYDNSRIRFTPLDAKIYFEDVLDCKSLILAGGTMEPLNNLLGIFKEANVFSYGSVCKNFVSYILSKGPSGKLLKLTFEHRDCEETSKELFITINNLVNCTRGALKKRNTHGGVVCFLPSKNFLKIFKERFNLEQTDQISYVFEDLKEFTKMCNSKMTVLFAVMGGTLSEGINFSDHFCRLLIIIGVPFPSINVEMRERIKFNGKDYITHIAMKTVNQALGRALRHKNDFAGIVLIDERYEGFQHLLSGWIREKITKKSFGELFRELHAFLQNSQC